MTASLLLPVAIIAAPAQEPQAGAQDSPIAIFAPGLGGGEAVASLSMDPLSLPPIVAPIAVSQAGPIAEAASSPWTEIRPAADPQEVPAPADSGAAELADPLIDPETAPPDATVQADIGAPKDPLEGFNRAMFGIHQGLDKAIYRPAAMGYKTVVPKPVRSGLRNFLSNLTEPIAFINYLLQLRIGKAARTLGRFTINSTLGFGGLLDVAALENVGFRHKKNSFGDTLAFYGVGPGPYLFLPLMGPTTLRDVLGGPIDGAVLPVVVGKPFDQWEFQLSTGVVAGLDLRAESDSELRALFSGAVDPYATLRSVWLQNRAAEVSELRHRRTSAPPVPELSDPLQDPAQPARPDAHE